MIKKLFQLFEKVAVSGGGHAKARPYINVSSTKIKC